jgi:uncharacterized protein (DUF2147 family)
MKKLFAIGGLMLLSGTLIATSANATALGSTAAGAVVTIANATAAATSPGPSLVFTPSPGVSMSASTLISSYAIAAANISAAFANRNEFGVWSGYSGYYQETSTALGQTATSTTCEDVSGYNPSAATTPFSATWKAMGGGS